MTAPHQSGRQSAERASGGDGLTTGGKRQAREAEPELTSGATGRYVYGGVRTRRDHPVSGTVTVVVHVPAPAAHATISTCSPGAPATTTSAPASAAATRSRRSAA